MSSQSLLNNDWTLNPEKNTLLPSKTYCFKPPDTDDTVAPPPSTDFKQFRLRETVPPSELQGRSNISEPTTRRTACSLTCSASFGASGPKAVVVHEWRDSVPRSPAPVTLAMAAITAGRSADPNQRTHTDTGPACPPQTTLSLRLWDVTHWRFVSEQALSETEELSCRHTLWSLIAIVTRAGSYPPSSKAPLVHSHFYFPFVYFSALTWSVVAAAALLAEAPEQRGDVVSQHAAAVLDQEANELAHLWRETQHRLEDTDAFLSSLLFSENQPFLMLHIFGRRRVSV